MRPLHCCLLTALASIAMPLATSGQELCDLVPEAFRTASGQVLRVRQVPERADLLEQDRQSRRVEWLLVRAAGRQRNLHDLVPDDQGWLEVEPLADGLTFIGIDSPLRPATLSGAELNGLARRWVRDEATRRRAELLPDAAAVAVRHSASAAALIQVGEAWVSSATALAKTGQAAELRLLFDPTVLREPGDVPVRAYVEGSAAAGRVIEVRCGEEPRPREVVTDATGHGRVRIDRGGVWRLGFVGVVAPEEDPGGPWRVASTTLRFEVVFPEVVR